MTTAFPEFSDTDMNDGKVLPSDINIIPLEDCHIPMVCKVEEDNFTDPWSEESFRSILMSSFAFSFGAFDGVGCLLGYIILSFVVDVGEVLDIAVAVDRKKMGVGTQLMSHAHSFLKEKGGSEVFLEVRESNTAARSLYSKQGYEAVGIRKNYYSNPKENAIMMKKALN